MQKHFSPASMARITEDAVFRKLEAEAVILNLETGTYFGLDAVGTRIWELIQQQGRVDAVLEALLQEYEVEPARCERELLELLQQLSTKGLIEIIDGETQAPS
jgi:Coenzyme PQQ synthesis protein D (PqqD)